MTLTDLFFVITIIAAVVAGVAIIIYVAFSGYRVSHDHAHGVPHDHFFHDQFHNNHDERHGL